MNTILFTLIASLILIGVTKLSSYKNQYLSYLFLSISITVLVGLTTYPIYQSLQSPIYLLALLSIFFGGIWVTVIFAVTKTIPNIIPKLVSGSSIFLIIYTLGFYLAPIRKWLIETVTIHTQYGLQLLGYPTEIVTGPDYGYQSKLVYESGEITYTTFIELACTGLGAIAIISGIIWILNATTNQKILYASISIVVIYGLNFVRNVFVAIAFFEEWFGFVPFVDAESSALVSFTIAEVYIGQVVSAILLFTGLFVTYLYTDHFDRLEQDWNTFEESHFETQDQLKSLIRR